MFLRACLCLLVPSLLLSPRAARAEYPVPGARAKVRESASSAPASAPSSRPTSATSAPSSARSGRRAPAKDAEARLAKARQLFALQRYAEARDLYRQALREQPARVGLLLPLAGCFERLGGAQNLAEAQKLYRRYLMARPESPLRGKVQRRLRRLEQRERALVAGDAPEKVPAYKKWWFWTGLALVVGGVIVGIVLSSQVDDDVPSVRRGLRTAPVFSF